MSEGLEIYNDSGTLQFSTIGYNLGLLATVTLTTATFSGSERVLSFSSGYVNYPQLMAEDVIGVALPDGYYLSSIDPDIFRSLYGTVSLPRYLTDIPVSTNVTCYVFRPMKYMAPGGYGVETYDASGLLTFSSNLQPMRATHVLNDGTTSVATSNGAHFIVADGVAGYERTTNSSGTIVDNRARITRSGNTYALSWASSTSQTGYPPSLNIINNRPSVLLVNIYDIDTAIIPGLPAAPANGSGLGMIKVTAGATSATLRASGLYRCVTTSLPSNSSSMAFKWQYRNVTTGGSWTDVPSTSRTISASNTVVVEPPAPNQVTYTDTTYGYTDTHTGLTVGHVYDYQCIRTPDANGTMTLPGANTSSSVVTYAADPAIDRAIEITPVGTISKKATGFSKDFASEIFGGSATTPSWTLTGIAGGGGSLTLNSSSGASTSVTAAGLAPQQSKGATLTASTSIDGFSRSKAEAIAFKNTQSGATIPEMSPTSELKVANSASQTFTKTITPTNPYSAPVTYNWSTPSGSGTWAITAGQGTNSATFTVSGAPTNTELTASLYCNVQADGDAFTRYGTVRYYNSPTGVYVSNQSPNGGEGTGTTASWTFPATTITVTGGGTPSYVWSVVAGIGGGTWSITGTGATRTLSVIGMGIGSFGQRTLRCVVTVDGTSYTRDSLYNYTREGSD